MADTGQVGSEIIMDQTAPGQRLLPDDLVRPPCPEERDFEHTFTQVHRFPRYRRTFRLFSGRFLQVSDNRARHSRQYVLNLALLDPEPVRYQRIAWRWVMASVVLIIAGAAALSQHAVLPGAAMIATALLGAIRAWVLSDTRLVFHSLAGRTPVAAVDTGIGQARTGREFAELLGQRIRTAGAAMPGHREALALEMAEHRRLHKDGALSGEEYERARKKILSGFNQG